MAADEMRFERQKGYSSFVSRKETLRLSFLLVKFKIVQS